MDEARWILIVDCEAKLRYTLSVILKRAGYAVIGVGTASEALWQLTLRPFHGVCLELCLPDVDGTHLLAEIRRLYPCLPLLILTGDDSVETTLRALQLGASGYLLKPLNPYQILACLEKILAESRARKRAGRRVSPRSRVLTS